LCVRKKEKEGEKERNKCFDTFLSSIKSILPFARREGGGRRKKEEGGARCVRAFLYNVPPIEGSRDARGGEEGEKKTKKGKGSTSIPCSCFWEYFALSPGEKQEERKRRKRDLTSSLAQKRHDLGRKRAAETA